jgi:hypothetical protein
MQDCIIATTMAVFVVADCSIATTTTVFTVAATGALSTLLLSNKKPFYRFDKRAFILFDIKY